MDKSPPGQFVSSLHEFNQQLVELVHLLEPMTSVLNQEMAMRTKRVLLADTDKKQQIVAKMALGGTGVDIQGSSSLEEAREKLKQKNFDIIFVDTNMLDLVPEIKKKAPLSSVVLLTSDPIPDYLPKIKKLQELPHIVTRSEQDRTFSLKNIMTTVTKLATNDIMGLEKYLNWGVEVHELKVTSSQTRRELIDKTLGFFQDIGIRRSNRERCATVLEELLMNAIYDAPQGPDGKSLYNHLPRTESVELSEHQHSTLRYATDGILFAVSVEDPFGGLKPDVLLKYLESCYSGQAGSLNRGKGGAGRGLHQIVENSDLVVFNLIPSQRTEIIALFRVEVKESTVSHPCFHLFSC